MDINEIIKLFGTLSPSQRAAAYEQVFRNLYAQAETDMALFQSDIENHLEQAWKAAPKNQPQQ